METKNTTVYISNLSYERDRSGLISLFSKYGTIKHIKIVVEPSTNQSRGMAFVQMSSYTEAKCAIDGLNGVKLDGRTVKCKWATPMKETSKPKTKVDRKEKDLDFKSIQLAKKARNDAKRKSNPFTFKAKAK